MALSTAVFVGKAKDWLPHIVEKAKNLKLGPGAQDGVDCSPVAYVEV